MKHPVVVVEVDEELEEDMVVVVVVLALAVTLPMMITHLLPLEPLQIKVLLKKEMLASLQKGAVMVDLVGLIVEVVVEVSAMVKLAKKGAHEGHLSAAVGQAAGELSLTYDFFFFNFCFYQY